MSGLYERDDNGEFEMSEFEKIEKKYKNFEQDFVKSLKTVSGPEQSNFCLGVTVSALMHISKQLEHINSTLQHLGASNERTK